MVDLQSLAMVGNRRNTLAFPAFYQPTSQSLRVLMEKQGNNNLLDMTAHGMNLSVPHTALDPHLGDIQQFGRFGYCCSLPGADLPLSSSLFLLPVGLLQEQFSGKT